jgi:hypothetical protein
MDSAYLPFSVRVDHAIEHKDFGDILGFLQSANNADTCRTDPPSVARLLNNLARLNMIGEINQCFMGLLRVGYVFDSVEYVEPMRLLGAHGRWGT